jgi:hypothetical protein
MRLVSRLWGQELRHLINNYVIHATLHRAKQVMVKVWDVDGLVNHQVERPPGQWISVGHHTTHGLINTCSEGFVIAYYGDWSVEVKSNQGMPT